MIEQKQSLYCRDHVTLNAFDYSRLTDAFYNYREDGFAQHKELFFRAPTGCAYLTGNELLQYPELAKILRDTPNYPIFEKAYPVNDHLRGLKGLDFLAAFLEFAKECDADFKNEVAAINTTINNLIYLHGTEKTKPVINDLHMRENGSIDSLTISGISFNISNHYHPQKENPRAMIDVYCLINYRLLDVEYVSIEGAILKTPFLALRIAKSWKHTGRVIWYNLDKMEVMETKEINAIKKTGEYIEVKRERK